MWKGKKKLNDAGMSLVELIVVILIMGILSAGSAVGITYASRMNADSAAEASRSQADMLGQIDQGIEQISTVVQSNSAASEETSAISEELSAQAIALREMVSAFKLREE